MRYEILNKLKDEINSNEYNILLKKIYKLNFKNNKYYKVNTKGNLKEITEESLEIEQEWIKERDLFSTYSDPNKSFNAKNKRIMSTNFYSLIVKIENLINKKVTIKNIEEDYFNKFEEQYNNIKNHKKDINTKLISQIDLFDLEEFKKSRQALITAMKKILNNIEELEKEKGYIKIKIFYDIEYNKFIKEFERYLTNKLFVENKYCKEINGKIYGIPKIDITLNANKPHLRKLTMPNPNVNYKSLEEGILLYKINLLFKVFNNKSIYINKNSKLNNLNNKELIDYIGYTKLDLIDNKGLFTVINNSIQLPFDIEKKIKIYNYMQLKEKDNSIYQYKEITYIELEEILNKLLNNNIKKNFCNDYIILKKFCENGNKNNMKNIYKRFLNNIILYQFKDINRINYINKNILELLNIKYSLEEILEGRKKEMDINKIYININNKIKENEVLENDEEYLFLYGQVYYYLISQSKRNNKNLNFINLPLKLTNEKILKIELKRLFDKYNYLIYINNRKLKKVMNMLMTYKIKGKINIYTNDMLYIGLLKKENIFYEKQI